MSKIVTFEQGMQLKRLGFRERTRAYYIDGSIDYNNPINWNTNEGLDENGESQEEDEYCSAPTVSEALDFIREKYQIGRIYFTVRYGNGYIGTIYYGQMHDFFRNISFTTDNYNTYIEAESALLNAVLEYLEKGTVK